MMMVIVKEEKSGGKREKENIYGKFENSVRK